MKTLVPTKLVPDPDQRVRTTADGSGIDDTELYYVPNPFDLIAVEEALVIREREDEEVEIVTVGIGPKDYEKESGSKETMCLFTIDEEVALHGSEPILLGDEVLGIVTSGGIGHTVGKTITMGYLPTEKAKESNYAIAAFGVEYPATRSDSCAYDPERERILC